MYWTMSCIICITEDWVDVPGLSVVLFVLQKIGLMYLDYLLDERDFDGAAQLCVKILGKKKELWEAQVWKFHKIHQLKVSVKSPMSNPRLVSNSQLILLNSLPMSTSWSMLNLMSISNSRSISISKGQCFNLYVKFKINAKLGNHPPGLT